MEELNKIIESDARSVTSRKSGSVSSELNTETDSPTRSSSEGSRQNSCPLDDDDNIDLWTVWSNLIKSWDYEMKKRPNDVKDLVRRGIPNHFRTVAWQLLSKANTCNVNEAYAKYLKQSSPFEKVIIRDMPRTYPELKFFKEENGRGQTALFNVIKAYSIHDQEVGYCQGSAFIVGQLLLQMKEEEAFAVFVRLMENYRLRELYKPTMTDLGLCMFQLDCLVQERFPDLHTHFNNVGFDTSMYASSWFLTLFTTSLPLDLANRIMDFFLVDGMEAIFRIAIVILQNGRFELLRLDMEGMLKYFQRIREVYENDHELLLTVACQITLNAKKMKKLEKEYLTKRTKEQDEAIELRRLRTENRLLRQRIDYLECESSSLADRLIRGQVDLAHKAENCLNISHELIQLRDINTDAHKRIEEAYETIRELSSRPKNFAITTADNGVQVDDISMIEHIHSLQQELIETHGKKSDLENCVRDIKARMQDLEMANKRLREQPPDEGIATLQEELIQVKMREAEASLSLKEMRQRFSELEQQWAKYVHARTYGAQAMAIQSFNTSTSDVRHDDDSGVGNSPDGGSPSSSFQPPANQAAPMSARGRLANFTAKFIGNNFGGSNDESAECAASVREMEDHLMGLRIREADAVAELKEMRQKVMELETQSHVCTNQLKRQSEELKLKIADCERLKMQEEEALEQLKEEQRKSLDIQADLKEKAMTQRMKYSEAMNSMAELKQQLAQHDSKNAESLACAQLRGTSVCDMDDDSNASHKSYHSGLDNGSLASEEMSALIADITIKIPEFVSEERRYLDSDEEVAQSGEKNRRPLRKGENTSVNATNNNTVPLDTPKNKARAMEDDTTDSGLNLSDN
uniref:Rab-GAP TBC domain-containing protein n=1 Tax=Rhabditophanes sp. KR3021 TaxID=114890 RepID=A0AC35TJM7_9BILA